MKNIKTYNIERIFYKSNHWLILNKMVLNKSFFKGALYDRSKLVYGYSNEEGKRF